MSNYCVMCGSPIPEGQRTCSMCYGDPYHGNDGYYLSELERQAEADAERQAEDERRCEEDSHE